MSNAVVNQSSVFVRDAADTDRPTLLELEGSAPHTGAALVQASGDFFARAHAYPVSRVLVAERDGATAGVLCVALDAVRVSGDVCHAAYLFNLRVAPALQRQGVGPFLMQEAWRWAVTHEARYCTGLVLASNRPSLKMTAGLGYWFLVTVDYLVISLSRFGSRPRARVDEVDLPTNPLLTAWRVEKAANYNLVPAFLEKELFARPPQGSYAGSLAGLCADGMAWLSLWDDRRRRGLDPRSFGAVKGFDLTLEGPDGLDALRAIFFSLRERGLDTLLLPLLRHDPARPLLVPLADEVLEFAFILKPREEIPPPVTRSIFFDIRH